MSDASDLAYAKHLARKNGMYIVTYTKPSTVHVLYRAGREVARRVDPHKILKLVKDSTSQPA